ADHIAWPLKLKHYDALRADAQAPHLLVVLLLPKDLENSVEHSAEQLVLRRCAYWVTMTGMAPASSKTSTTVQLPKTQLFSPDALTKILGSVSEGQLP